MRRVEREPERSVLSWTASQAYASVTGIFELFDTYSLAPRSGGDFIR
jgi:hypothetical protein